MGFMEEQVANRNGLTILLGAAVVFFSLLSSGIAEDQYVVDAMAYVAKVSQSSPPWDGPRTGPLARPKKTVVYVSADQNNGGAFGVGRAASEAAKTIGWNIVSLDGQGTPSGRTAALMQAMALKPDGIILGTVDAIEQAELIGRIAAKGIKIVGWHALDKPGPAVERGVFTNIETNPVDVATAAAMYAVADSGGTAQVVIFTDPAYAIGVAKSDAMADVIRKCRDCSILSVERIHHGEFRETSALMSHRTAQLLQSVGKRWTYGLADNDLYFDFMLPSLVAAEIPSNGRLKLISAGDGSDVAFERVRARRYQVATVAEPLSLHGWQSIDELNRAFSGDKNSGYSTPVHLVTNSNIGLDGGPRNEFDPGNGYREIYKRIWGVN